MREGGREGGKGGRKDVDVPNAVMRILDALHGYSLDEGLENRQEVLQKCGVFSH